MEKSTGINYCGGDSIGRVVIFELNKHTSDFFDGILEMAKRHSELEISSLVHEPVLSLPGLEIDLTHRKVYCGNKEVSLTTKEYALLCLLVANENRVLTYDQIYEKVWREEAFGSTNNAIKCHIRNLRDKLREANPDAPFSIRCVREVGYCFELTIEKRVTT